MIYFPLEQQKGVLEQLEEINAKRAAYFPDNDRLLNMDILWYANAIAGETGEFCNLVKKKLRGDIYDRDGVTKLTKEYICQELADIIIYCEFAANICGLSLSEIVAKKFNAVSTEMKIDSFIKTQNTNL